MGQTELSIHPRRLKRQIRRERKSGAKRPWLIALIILLFVAAGAGGYFASLKIWPKSSPSAAPIASNNSTKTNNAKTPATAPTKSCPAPANSSYPQYFSIPALQINDACVEALGLKADNQLDAPPLSKPDDVGWYDKSALPGQISGQTAGLYDCHNTTDSGKALCYYLKNLKAGDTISVRTGGGQTFTYSVVENEEPTLADIDMNKMLTAVKPGQPGLNIISCDGAWNKAAQTYDHRRTIRAALVENQ